MRVPSHRTNGRQSVPSRAPEAYKLHMQGWKLKDLAKRYNVSLASVTHWIRAVRVSRRDARVSGT